MGADFTRQAFVFLVASMLCPALACSDNASDLAAARQAAQIGDHALAVRLFTAALTSGLSIDDRAAAYGDRASAYRSQGKFALAISDYTLALKLRPNASDFLYRRGIAYYLAHFPDRAIADYTAALRREPGRRDAQTNRAYAYLAKGEMTRAIADFTDVLQVAPHDGSAHEGRGDAYFLVGRFSDAVEDFAATLTDNPGDVHDGLWLYLARIRAGEDGTQKLRIWAQTLTDHSWPYDVVQFYAGSIGRDDFAAASNYSVEASTKVQQQCGLYSYLGVYEAFARNGTAARALLRRALRSCDRNFAEFWLAAGELKRLGNGSN